MPDYLGQVLRGYQAGQGIATNRLAGEALNAPPANRQSALGQLASVNPQAAMSLQDRFQSQDAMQQQQAQAQEVDHAKKINGAARFMLQAVQSKDPARIQGAWNSVAPYLSEVTGKQAPPQWDDSMLPGLYQTLSATGGMTENKPVILSNGAQLVDPSTGQMVANNPLDQKDPEAIATLKMLQGNPQLMAMWERTHPRADSNGGALPKPPAGYRWTPDGNLAPIAGGPADPARKGAGGTVITNPDGSTTVIPAGKANTQELNNAGFYQRMVQADKDLSSLEKQGYDPTNIRDKLTAGGTLNALSSDNGQKYHQAAMNWVRANLRKESGAAIGAAEAEQEFRNYFPQIGDSDAVIAQKAQMRQVVEEAMRTASGPAIGRPAQSQPQQATTSSAPIPGEVQDGYRYKGGDPSSPASWEKV